MPSVLNAANEVAVEAFLKGKIKFTEIACIIRETMEEHDAMPDTQLDAVIEADRWARRKAQEIIKGIRQ